MTCFRLMIQFCITFCNKYSHLFLFNANLNVNALETDHYFLLGRELEGGKQDVAYGERGGRNIMHISGSGNQIPKKTREGLRKLYQILVNVFHSFPSKDQ